MRDVAGKTEAAESELSAALEVNPKQVAVLLVAAVSVPARSRPPACLLR